MVFHRFDSGWEWFFALFSAPASGDFCGGFFFIAASSALSSRTAMSSPSTNFRRLPAAFRASSFLATMTANDEELVSINRLPFRRRSSSTGRTVWPSRSRRVSVATFARRWSPLNNGDERWVDSTLWRAWLWGYGRAKGAVRSKAEPWNEQCGWRRAVRVAAGNDFHALAHVAT